MGEIDTLVQAGNEGICVPLLKHTGPWEKGSGEGKTNLAQMPHLRSLAMGNLTDKANNRIYHKYMLRM